MLIERKNKMIRKSYKYRAYPNKSTQKKAIKTMVAFADIWNIALKERQDTYELSKKDPDIKAVNSYYSQYHLIRKKEHPEYSNYLAQSMQDVLVKLDGSYKSFFGLIKKDSTARPPKEKNIHRCLSYSSSGWKLIDNNLHLYKIGRFKLRLHRQIEGKIKTVNVTLNKGKWYVCFSVEQNENILPKTNKTVQIKLSDYSLIKDSEGTEFKHPKFYIEEINNLRRLSRSLSRKEKKSNNRKSAKYTLGKWHERIANKRKNYLEKIALYYALKYDIIEIPKLPIKENIKQLTSSIKIMELCDASYGILFSMIKNKAKEFGRQVKEYSL